MTSDATRTSETPAEADAISAVNTALGKLPLLRAGSRPGP